VEYDLSPPCVRAFLLHEEFVNLSFSSPFSSSMTSFDDFKYHLARVKKDVFHAEYPSINAPPSIFPIYISDEPFTREYCKISPSPSSIL